MSDTNEGSDGLDDFRDTKFTTQEEYDAWMSKGRRGVMRLADESTHEKEKSVKGS